MKMDRPMRSTRGRTAHRELQKTKKKSHREKPKEKKREIENGAVGWTKIRNDRSRRVDRRTSGVINTERSQNLMDTFLLMSPSPSPSSPLFQLTARCGHSLINLPV